MTDFSDLLFNSVDTNILTVLIKYALLVSELLYGVYAYIVVRQVALMNKSFQTEFGPFFRLLSVLHFLAVAVVFFLSLILLKL